MFLNFRYHLVSLIAVFLALGIGIVIGSTFIPSALVEKQSNMVRQLEKDFTAIQRETKKYKIELQKKDAFEKEVLHILTTNKLSGLTLSIIETTEQTNDIVENNLILLLKKAGANVQSIITFKEGLDFSDTTLKDEILKHLGLQKHSLEKAYKNIVSRVASEISLATNQNLINYLQQKKVLQLSGNITKPVRLIIIVSEPATTRELNFFNLVDKPLIETLKTNGLRVVGVETTNGISQINKFQELSVSTVDNIDTIPGQIALIFVLAGYDGNYGYKKTARAILPRILVP